jgi:hypothetical protein
VAKYWKRPPSSYFPELQGVEQFVFDEACAMAVESEAKRIENEKKQKEKHKKFCKEMDGAFEDFDE